MKTAIPFHLYILQFRPLSNRLGGGSGACLPGGGDALRYHGDAATVLILDQVVSHGTSVASVVKTRLTFDTHT